MVIEPDGNTRGAGGEGEGQDADAHVGAHDQRKLNGGAANELRRGADSEWRQVGRRSSRGNIGIGRGGLGDGDPGISRREGDGNARDIRHAGVGQNEVEGIALVRLNDAVPIAARDVIGEILQRRPLRLEAGKRPAQVKAAARNAKPRHYGINRREQGLLDLGDGEVGVGGQQEGASAGNVRSGHRGAAHILIAAAGLATEDVAAGRRQIHGSQAIAGKVRSGIVVIGGHHGNDARRVVARWIMRDEIVVGARVAGRGREDDAGITGGLNGIFQRLAVTAPAPGIVHHVRLHERGVLN